MSDLTWSMFLAVGVMTFYLGWFEEEPFRAIINYSLSLIFWILTMYQWVLDNTQDNAMLYFYLLPISITLLMIYQRATDSYENAYHGYKRDPFV